MATSKRLLTKPKVKEFLDTHEQLDTSLLRGVEFEYVEDVLEECPIEELKKDDILMTPGQPRRFIYLLLSGRLGVHLNKLSTEPILILEPGEVAGEMSVVDHQPASAYVVAEEDCRVLVMNEKAIWALVDRYPMVARNLLYVLSQRVRRGNVLIEASLLEKVSEQELEEFQPPEVNKAKGRVQAEVADETLKLYKTATQYVLDSINKVQEEKNLNVKRGEQLAESMVDSVVDSSALLMLATDRVQEFTVSTHSVNVAILSIRLAQTLSYSLADQVRVGLAGLLHEIGVAWLPERLLHKTGQVSSEVRQRPVYGAKILGHLKPPFDWIAQTVGQVYERENGSGFPLGLSGEEIGEEAKILGIVDVFEACIHDRPYRNALTGYQLLEELTHDHTKSFSDRIVKALLNSFSLYPYNEYVLLNTKELARVVEVNPANSFRPLVQILYDSNGVPLEEPRETDLAQSSLLFISKAISYHELPEV
jgi:HD-GYP domain-containing protein (c-di-GMP phosphodiesterase class II)